jgi:hypothetical protein
VEASPQAVDLDDVADLDAFESHRLNSVRTSDE